MINWSHLSGENMQTRNKPDKNKLWSNKRILADTIALIIVAISLTMLLKFPDMEFQYQIIIYIAILLSTALPLMIPYQKENNQKYQ